MLNLNRYNTKIILLIMMSIFIGSVSAKEKPRWGKIKHKCTSGQSGLVWAKLKGVKFGQVKKTCEGKKGKTPPPFNALGASGKPDYCKTRPTGVYGYWKLDNDQQCKQGKKIKGKQQAYWDRPKHRCTGPGKGVVEAKLLGVDGSWWGKKGRKMDLCKSDNAPSINALGVSGRPNSCKKKLVHIYGVWKNNQDSLCEPVWKAVKNKGCMGPDIDNGGQKDRQVSRAKLTKLKNGGRWWQISKWKWPLTAAKRKWAREQCLNIVHPTKGKPDYCKVKSGVWAYWYKEVDQCDKPLEWAKFKDNGCVSDMQYPDLPGANLETAGKRSYSARLKKVAGDWYESCRTWPIENKKANNGMNLTASKPTGCILQDGDEAIGYVAGGGLSAGAAVFSLGGTAAASGAISVVGAAATTQALKAMDTTTSVDGVLWVDDASCQ